MLNRSAEELQRKYEAEKNKFHALSHKSVSMIRQLETELHACSAREGSRRAEGSWTERGLYASEGVWGIGVGHERDEIGETLERCVA